MHEGPEAILTCHPWPLKAQPWLQDSKLLIKPSDVVQFQVSLLESHRTPEQQEMMPELQRSDNKTQIKKQPPRNISNTTHQQLQTPTLGPGKNSERDAGTRNTELPAGSCPTTGAKVPRLICPCPHIQSRETFFHNIHISQGKLYSV